MAKQLHAGKLKPSDLDQGMLEKTYNTLNKGAADGYGAKYNTLTAQNTPTVQRIQQNIYQFSAAKTYQQLAEYNRFLTDENGKERSFNDFKKLVLDRHPKYNKNYLEAEYQTAKASGQMAAKWEGFQKNKERYPYLRYKTVGDDHVRDDHRSLDGFTAHIDDPIWDRIYPPNDWRCRCYVVQTNSKPEGDNKVDLSFMKPAFSVNVGKTGVVFNNEAHPYYAIPKKDNERVKLAFESMKLRLAYGKAKYVSTVGRKVFVHPMAKPETAYQNFDAAIFVSNNLSRNVKLRPHIDTSVLTKAKNPEYLINNKTGSIKTHKTINFSKAISSAIKDGSTIVIIDLINNDTVFATAKAEVQKLLKTTKLYATIKEVILISKDRATVESIKNE